MNDLVFVSPAESAVIKNAAFWPDIDLAEMRDAVRLDGNVTLPRLSHAAKEAIMRVNDELAGWRATQQLAGYDSLAAIPSDTIDGTSVLTSRYIRAVYCTAKALLTEGYRDIDTTSRGEKHAEALETQTDSQWRDSQWAIRDVMGLPRAVVEIV